MSLQIPDLHLAFDYVAFIAALFYSICKEKNAIDELNSLQIVLEHVQFNFLRNRINILGNLLSALVLLRKSGDRKFLLDLIPQQHKYRTFATQNNISRLESAPDIDDQFEHSAQLQQEYFVHVDRQ